METANPSQKAPLLALTFFRVCDGQFPVWTPEQIVALGDELKAACEEAGQSAEDVLKAVGANLPQMNPAMADRLQKLSTVEQRADVPAALFN